jgi:Calcineurin-like phosphoesterase
MDYREDGGVYSHPERRIIFVGDFIDRGPQQGEVVRIARNMCESGSALAVMGNHEFNALGWAEPDDNGGYLRPHIKQNEDQHVEFLNQIGEDPAAYHQALAWFRTLPIWLEMPGLRVVHACWYAPAQQALLPHLDVDNSFTRAGLREAYRKGSKASDAVEILLKGPEALLPNGRSFKDKQGHTRHEVRLRWWDPEATTLRKAALGMDGLESRLPDLPVTTDYQYDEATPVLFGHYWQQGTPVITTDYAACLDYSVAKRGFLTAYRWSGECILSPNNIVYVSAKQ